MYSHEAECEMIMTSCLKCDKLLTRTELKNSHDIADCFTYKYRVLEEGLKKSIEEENRRSQLELEKLLTDKIEVLEEENKKLRRNIEDTLQVRVNHLKEENVNLKKQIKLTKYASFTISSNPQVHVMLDVDYSKCTMDSDLLLDEQSKIWYIKNYKWTTIKCFDNLEAMKHNQFKEIKLPVTGYGTYWTIFKNSLYFSLSYTEGTFGKLNLSTNKLEIQVTLVDATMGNSTHSWGGGNDLLFISNSQSLYIVYESKTSKKLVISLMDSTSLEVIKSWETNAQPKKTYGSIFMINKTLYATRSYCIKTLIITIVC